VNDKGLSSNTSEMISDYPRSSLVSVWCPLSVRLVAYTRVLHGYPVELAIKHPDVNTYNSGSAPAKFMMHSPTARKPSFSFSLQSIQSDDSKICVVMVGLPARGKSLIAGKGMSQAWKRSA